MILLYRGRRSARTAWVVESREIRKQVTFLRIEPPELSDSPGAQSCTWTATKKGITPASEVMPMGFERFALFDSRVDYLAFFNAA